MYEYTWYQWLSFFYIYCFFGWIFESSYVSAKTHRLVNRGFLRLPLLPLYGTGAVMMLWVSLPIQSNLIMVFAAGMAAATLLEYVTGWAMERLFKVKYWDYSQKPWNIKGYICLSSSIAWGFLTLLLTEILHHPVEQFVLSFPPLAEVWAVCLVTLCFTLDTAQSVRTALDLARILESMTRIRGEWDELQVQIALLKAEAKDEAAARLLQLQANASEAAVRQKIHLEQMTGRVGELYEKRRELLSRVGSRHRNLLLGNPSATSFHFVQAFLELKHLLDEKRK